MDISKLDIGANAPKEVNVIVENPIGGEPVKYEIDKKTGMVFVDRFLHTSMYYPGNYGFIPHTLSGDGDPVDCLVLGNTKVMPGSVMMVRPVGVLMMEDDGGQDEKIIAVPAPKLHPYHDDIVEYTDIRPILREKIEHFFTHYKDLEKNKWSKTLGWESADKARSLILEGIERAKNEG
ncbi:MAG TPA: inorganic diphosphatase [Rhodospirillaceae bacterium]|nr:inorganic diphosphatase [Rhodospirillaceae bacterium]|tara:strand:- start:162 stop:695 length:534 start_codon:yes stop_codon:yes gene_type:complete